MSRRIAPLLRPRLPTAAVAPCASRPVTADSCLGGPCARDKARPGASTPELALVVGSPRAPAPSTSDRGLARPVVAASLEQASDTDPPDDTEPATPPVARHEPSLRLLASLCLLRDTLSSPELILCSRRPAAFTRPEQRGRRKSKSRAAAGGGRSHDFAKVCFSGSFVCHLHAAEQQGL